MKIWIKPIIWYSLYVLIKKFKNVLSNSHKEGKEETWEVIYATLENVLNIYKIFHSKAM
jgi:hypothetical protein